MSGAPSWLPPLVKMEGEWNHLLMNLYRIFERDFKQNPPNLEGRRVWWNRQILPGDIYEEGFWHLITKTNWATKQRLPDYRRAERLPWCAPTISNSRDALLTVWDYEETRGKIRTYLWLEHFDYVVILEKQNRSVGQVAFLITAFYLYGDSDRRRLRRKYKKRCQ